MNEIISNYDVFDSIKHINELGFEYWEARELMKVLEYNKWENFHKVIKNAMITCENSGCIISDHFPEVRKMVEVGSDTKRKILDYNLSRYGCYLIAQNGDSRKKTIALAQTYFAVQTRIQYKTNDRKKRQKKEVELFDYVGYPRYYGVPKSNELDDDYEYNKNKDDDFEIRL